MDYQPKFTDASTSKRQRSRKIILWISVLTSTIFFAFFFYRHVEIRKPFQNYLCPNQFPFETIFRKHDEYYDFSHAGDSVWDTPLTPNGGFVVLDQPDKQTYGVAMFHQLHCLQMIRSTMQSLSNQTSVEVVGHSGHHHGRANEEGVSSHVMHCLDYIRQSILCFADDSLEKPVERTKEGYVINGYGPHKCRSKDELYKASLDTGLLEP